MYMEVKGMMCDVMIKTTWFERPDGSNSARGIHGTGHTKRVLSHALEIAAALGLDDWEVEAIRLAACWHDIGRTNDGADYYHGAKSAGKVMGLKLYKGVESKILEAALFAVTHHCGCEEHAERAAGRIPDDQATLRIFRVLKDADALDRVRLGGLDTSFLRFEVSHTYVPRAWKLLEEMTG